MVTSCTSGIWIHRRHLQEIDLGAPQYGARVRPSHDPNKTFGFVGVVISRRRTFRSSIWMWYREDGGKNGKWGVRKVIEFPA